jgi:hypothetical protein
MVTANGGYTLTGILAKVSAHGPLLAIKLNTVSLVGVTVILGFVEPLLHK